jgi:acetyl-CoA carboxylase, biotin carboxylase subunit
VQRNHQKLVEESPSPVISEAQRQETCETAARAAARVGYVGAGTMELLLDPATNVLRFMEMNCRLQVEHTVSEERSGVDLVKLQIEVAAGRALPFTIECRINAEDPTANFAPAPGMITRWSLPNVADAPAGSIRVDTHVEQGYVVPPHYDSLICKVIASGADRNQAIERMIAALSSMVCEGVPTTIPMHLAILRSDDFRSNRYDTRAIPGWSSSTH